MSFPSSAEQVLRNDLQPANHYAQLTGIMHSFFLGQCACRAAILTRISIGDVTANFSGQEFASDMNTSCGQSSDPVRSLERDMAVCAGPMAWSAPHVTAITH